MGHPLLPGTISTYTSRVLLQHGYLNDEPVLCASPPISTLRMCSEAPNFGYKMQNTAITSFTYYDLDSQGTDNPVYDCGKAQGSSPADVT